jgi:hypothetical protein
VTEDEQDRYYLNLKGARERLCRAQTFAPEGDGEILQGAIARIDLVATDLPQWSRYDGGRWSDHPR